MHRNFLFTILSALALGVCDLPAAETVARVTDLNPVYEQGGDRLSDSWPRSLTVLKSALYLIASDGNCTGLWRFDGTNAVVLGGGLLNQVSEIVVCDEELYFDADDGLYGRELWKVVTSPKPRLQIDLEPGSARVLLCEAETGQYVVEMAESPDAWAPLSTNRPVDGQIILRDGLVTNRGVRLYRTVRAK